jgi:hypothetical protein
VLTDQPFMHDLFAALAPEIQLIALGNLPCFRDPLLSFRSALICKFILHTGLVSPA